MEWYDALIFGLFQCLGIMPGISRSGSCIVGGKVAGYKQSDAAEFAFLMAIPIMLGSAVAKVPDIATSLSADTSLWLPYILSFLVTGVVTFFSIYCALLGITSIILQFTLCS